MKLKFEFKQRSSRIFGSDGNKLNFRIRVRVRKGEKIVRRSSCVTLLLKESGVKSIVADYGVDLTLIIRNKYPYIYLYIHFSLESNRERQPGE